MKFMRYTMQIEIEVITEVVNGVSTKKIIPTGTLDNIKEYAKNCFEGDVDQEQAFIQLVAAFVVRLHDKAIDNNIIKKRFRNGKRKYDFDNDVAVYVRQGEIEHIATLTDSKILSMLKEINEADDGIDFINLSRLELHTSQRVQIKWRITNQIEYVDWKSVKLIGIPTETRTTGTHYL